MALGVDPAYRYKEYAKQDWTPGSLVLIGTDGLSETRNAKGVMFGDEQLRKVVREYRESSAIAIKNAVFTTAKAFRQGRSPEDDTTLVVVKLGATN